MTNALITPVASLSGADIFGIIASFIVCVFPFAGGIRSDKVSVAIAILQAALVAVAVVVVFQLDNPFTGPLATTPDSFTQVAALVGAR